MTEHLPLESCVRSPAHLPVFCSGRSHFGGQDQHGRVRDGQFHGKLGFQGVCMSVRKCAL